MKEALNRVEGLANVNQLSERDSLRLRLLAEETFGLVRGMTGDFQAVFWAEDENGMFTLDLEAEVNKDKADDLKSMATVPEVFKEKGVMGKIRGIFRNAMVSGKLAAAAKGTKGDSWSLKSYMADTKEEEGNQEAYDELEKSVVAKLADDVTVSVNEGRVRMVVYKKK